eukprot:1157779-Pelagomonas_calceolata.AAC.14
MTFPPPPPQTSIVGSIVVQLGEAMPLSLPPPSPILPVCDASVSCHGIHILPPPLSHLCGRLVQIGGHHWGGPGGWPHRCLARTLET